MHPGAYDLLAKRFLNVRKTVFNHGFAVVFKTVWQTHTFSFNINVNGKRTCVRFHTFLSVSAAYGFPYKSYAADGRENRSVNPA